MSTDADVLTITADDYTVSLDLTNNDMFNQFYTDPNNREHIFTHHKGSAVAAFRQYIIEELPL